MVEMVVSAIVVRVVVVAGCGLVVGVQIVVVDAPARVIGVVMGSVVVVSVVAVRVVLVQMGTWKGVGLVCRVRLVSQEFVG